MASETHPQGTKPGQRRIDTGGGSYVEGDANIGGDFIGRDQINIYLSEKSRLWVNVPSMPNHFVGRETMVDDLVHKLTEGGTYALSAEGLPGVGKTTLAVALAHHKAVLAHFEDGVLWAGLGPQGDAAGALLSWAEGLGIDIRDRVTNEARRQAIKQAIGDRALLLVIDDGWELEAAQLLRCGGPKSVHLLTTRDQAVARDFAGIAQVESVPVLETVPAHELLRTLAPEAWAADPEQAASLADAVDGLPLALELLGGYLAVPERIYFEDLAVEALAELTDPRQRLQLATQRLGEVKRQQVTLEETIALSVEHLPAEARCVFYALGAFAPKPDTFDREAAEDVAETGAKELALLLARNLLEREGDSLALHQTLSDVARTQTSAETYIRHRDYYLALVDEDRQNWQRIEAVYGQIKQAWQRTLGEADKPRLLDFVWALRLYQERRGLWQDYLAWANHGLEWTRANDEQSDEAALLNNIGSVYDALGDKQQALETYNQALSLFRDVGDRSGEATTLNNIGSVYSALGEKQQALDYFNLALPLRRDVGDRSGEASTLNNIGGVYFDLGDKQQALDYYNQALSLRRAVGDRSGEAATLNNIGGVYDDLGDKQQALDYYNQALHLFRDVGGRRGEATTLNNIGRVYDDLGEKQQALETYNQALSLFRDVGDRSGEATTLNNIGGVYSALGDKQQALDYYNQALSLFRDVGDRSGEATTLNNIGSVYSALGDKQQALETYNQALPLFRDVGDRSGEASTLNNIGSVYSALGDKQQALETYNQALPLRREVGDRSGESVTRFNMAMIYVSLGDLEKAEKELLLVVALDEAIDHPDLESDRERLAQVQALRRNEEKKH